MIAGHLQIKNDNYYMVLNYTDANGKRRQPWIPTGLPAKGNKRHAEKLLLDTRKSFVPPVVSKENEDISSDMLFADYMELWLEIIRSSVEKTTFSSYTQMVKGKIAPYFRNTGLTLDGIQAKHIQSFYLHALKTVSPGTVIHYHANIHKALKYAVKMDLIPFNPADKVERPKKQRYIADYYRQEELERLLEASKDHPYSLLIQMTAFYGLRRSEALGLKWDAIDFERDTITIKHIVTNAKIDGKCEIVCADRAKTKSSLRSLPLVSNIREKLLALREQQKENRRVCGNCYSKKYDGYVFVDAMGNIFNPRSVTANFSKLLEQNGRKCTITTRAEQSYGRVPPTGLCRLFISVYVPGAGLPGARASAFPAPHESEICPDRAAYSAPAIDTHKAQCRWPWPFPPANTQWHWIPPP